MLKRSGISVNATYQQIEKKLNKEEAFVAVDEDRRQILVSAYLRALADKLSSAERKAEERLRVNE